MAAVAALTVPKPVRCISSSGIRSHQHNDLAWNFPAVSHVPEGLRSEAGVGGLLVSDCTFEYFLPRGCLGRPVPPEPFGRRHQRPQPAQPSIIESGGVSLALSLGDRVPLE